MKYLLSLVMVLVFAVSAEAISAITYFGCGTSGVTYYAIHKNTGLFWNGTDAFDSATSVEEAATQVSDRVWYTDDFTFDQDGETVAVFLDSGGNECTIVTFGR